MKYTAVPTTTALPTPKGTLYFCTNALKVFPAVFPVPTLTFPDFCLPSPTLSFADSFA